MDIVSALVGGGLALVGAFLTQRMTSKRDAESHERERAERQERDLKLAYVDWLSANQRAMVVITSMATVPKEQQQDAVRLAQSVGADMTTAGSKVRVLETDAIAREKVAEAMQILSVFGAKVAKKSESGFAGILDEVVDAAAKLGDIDRWVLAKRFPPKTGEPPRPAASDTETSPLPDAAT